MSFRLTDLTAYERQKHIVITAKNDDYIINTYYHVIKIDYLLINDHHTIGNNH